MTIGFTITSEEGIAGALELGSKFMAAVSGGKFHVVVMGNTAISPQILSNAPTGMTLRQWSDFSIDAEFFPHWPLIFSADRVLGLLIVHCLNTFLATGNDVWYVNAGFNDSESPLFENIPEKDFHLVAIPHIAEATLTDFAASLMAVYVRQESHDLIRQWSQQLDCQGRTGSLNFVSGVIESLKNIDKSCTIEIVSHGQELFTASNVWTQSTSGLPIRTTLRNLALQDLLGGSRDLPSPFQIADKKRFTEWGMSISPNSVSALPRFLDAAIQDNQDLYREFVLFDFSDVSRSRKWWKRQKSLLEPEIKFFKTRHLVRKTSKLEVVDTGPRSEGVDLFGYLSSGAGVGQAARLMSDTLQMSGIDTTEVSLPRPRSVRVNSETYRFEVQHDIALMCVDAYQFVKQRHVIGEKYFDNRYTIAQWYWELEEVPGYYREPLSLIDEFWAPTKFLANAMASIAPPSLRITHMPLPIVSPGDIKPLSKEDIGLANRFLFYFSFDFLSVMKRKNPQAVVRAFVEAFNELDGAALLIKSINGIQRPRELNELHALVGDRHDIKIVDEFLAPQMNSALMATADCYVSLHRSEGYGLTLAEAMALGKPVIATAYSGNLDFMTNDSSILIPHSLVKVGDNAEGYPSHSSWAEPDHAHAVAAMQKMVDDRNIAKDLGEAARQHIERNFSIAVVAEKMAERIHQIQTDSK